MRRATYRMQLRPGFGFAAAEHEVDYLAALGVSHLYCSPCLQAVPGSTHGYDVIDHRQVSRDLGGERRFRRLAEALKQHGMDVLLDVVPNHMAIGHYNPVWWDVLENGPSSRYADFFDVKWAHHGRLAGHILLPLLGDHSGRAIDSGEIRLAREGASFSIRYFDHRAPMSPRTLPEVLSAAAGRADSMELAFLADAFAQLPAITATDTESRERRHRDRAVLFRLLERTLREHPELGEQVDAVLDELNASPERLDAFLVKQHCRLAFWRVGSQDLGYRRFFDIDTLAALRMEDRRVFEETHGLILSWLRDGLVDGLRIDHPDGLQDPEEYLERIRPERLEAWIVVEKILEHGETLRESWSTSGTSGYDFMNVVARLFVDSSAEPHLTQFYQDFTGDTQSWDEHVLASKHVAMRELLGSDVNRLAELFLDICENHRRYRDFTRLEIHEVLSELLASLPVYRTYFRPGKAPPHAIDLALLSQALIGAKARRPDLDPELFDFLESVLSLKVDGRLESELVWRFQQLSAPVMAKGVEDTASYRYLRFVALNEVGGAPGRFGSDAEELHVFATHTARHWPESLLATSTHDTKRSEDVRARLWVLSEMPEVWTRAVSEWSEMLAPHRTEVVDRRTEYLLYQTLVGAYPLGFERLEDYLLKALREAKLLTSWTRQDTRYEAAVLDFAEKAVGDEGFGRSLARFVPPVVAAGRVNSLSQILIKVTAPGIPDVYQGTELWDLSLVDPDNRRPVDFALRRKLLEEVRHSTPEQVAAAMDRGLPKLFVLHRALELRKRRSECFAPGASYEPVYARGPGARHVVGFLRGDAVLTLVPRLRTLAAESLSATEIALPPGHWVERLSGRDYRDSIPSMSELWEPMPVALLEREGGA